MTDVTDSGILTTASNLLFTGGREGYFQALDARTGALLWKTNLGAAINSGPITYPRRQQAVRLDRVRPLAVRVRARRIVTSGFRLKPEATCTGCCHNVSGSPVLLCRKGVLGILWRYSESGSGRPLVLLHGIGMSHVAWNAVTPYLCSTRRVIAFDIAGFGSTPPLPRGTLPTIANLVEGLARSIDDWVSRSQLT